MGCMAVMLLFPILMLGGTQGLTLYTFDLTYTLKLEPKDAYEQVHLIAAISGLANREGPRFYYFYTDVDEEWLTFMQSSWLKNATIAKLDNITDVVSTFSHVFHGAVLYDPEVPATSNVASTIAGVDNLLPICKRTDQGSMYNVLVATGVLHVVTSLVGKFTGNVTGSKKCDAYMWAKEQYLDKGLTDPTVMGYFVDYFWTTVASKSPSYRDNTVSNQDFFIARRGFMWDLSSWGDEAPNDDPHQPVGTDLKTLQAVLLSAYEQTKGQRMNMIGGFTPWAFKYTDGKHGGVATEWQCGKVTSAYNAYVSADACCVGGMANAALFQHYPVRDRYVQNTRPSPNDLAKLGYLDNEVHPYVVQPYTYVSFYVGDYDSAAWLYSESRSKWDDPQRGSVPLGWAIDPTLSERFPLAFEYFYSTRSPQDFFTTGDSGAGYINPTQLFEPRELSGLPSADKVWVEHCNTYYSKFDMTFTGFIINGASGDMSEKAQDMYTSFSWDGMTDQTGYAPHKEVPYITGNTPVFQEQDIPGGNPQKAAQQIAANFHEGKTDFQVYRSVLQSASYHKTIVEELAKTNPHIKVVDPLSLGYLARQYMGGNNNDRVSYVSDTLSAMGRDESVNVTFEVRNNGWNTLDTTSSDAAKRVSLRWSLGLATGEVYATAAIAAGETGAFTGRVALPGNGQHVFSYQLRRGLTEAGDFSNLGNIPHKRDVSL